MPRLAPDLQPRLRLPHAGADAFGPGKAELLRHVAARSLGASTFRPANP